MTINELILKTGDSELLDLKYDCNRNVLEFTLELDVLDQEFTFEVVTKEFRLGNLNLRNRNCHLELVNLSDKLTIANNVFVPASDFGKFMQETRKGYNLAYGKRISEIGYLLTLTGSDNFFMATISSLEAVKFNEKKELVIAQ